ncbi:hypothetical protein JGE30_24355, partial [Salmonella enterica subsp. enterica serovar Give]|nr:hypothetical protein [Salmonella enterica subsp. enterica serovar Give]
LMRLQKGDKGQDGICYRRQQMIQFVEYHDILLHLNSVSTIGQSERSQVVIVLTDRFHAAKEVAAKRP